MYLPEILELEAETMSGLLEELAVGVALNSGRQRPKRRCVQQVTARGSVVPSRPSSTTSGVPTNSS
jgi:hypothetical protein